MKKILALLALLTSTAYAIDYDVISKSSLDMLGRDRVQISIVAAPELTKEERVEVMKLAALEHIENSDMIRVFLKPFDASGASIVPILGSMTYAVDKCGMVGPPSGCSDNEWSDGQVSGLTLTDKQIAILKAVWIAEKDPKFRDKDDEPKLKEMSEFVGKQLKVKPSLVLSERDRLLWDSELKKIE